MAKFRMEVELDNDCMVGDFNGLEKVMLRTINRLANLGRVKDNEGQYTIMDPDGNTVGSFSLEGDE